MTTYYLFEMTIGVLLTLCLRELFRRMWHASMWRIWSVVVCSTVVFALIWTCVKVALFLYLFDDVLGDAAGKMISEWFPDSLSCFATWSAIYFAFCYERSSHIKTQQLHHVETSAKDAHIRMLQYQLNPHFLFNALASINALIGEKRDENAREMLTQLSDFLRSSLNTNHTHLHKIEEEIGAIERYLAIESVRFQKRLNIQFDVASESLCAKIPPLLLQPLAENAIKHHVAVTSEVVTVLIRIRLVTQWIVIEIINESDANYASMVPGMNSEGVGLENCKERLWSLFGAQAKLNYSSVSDRSFKVHISFPAVLEV